MIDCVRRDGLVFITENLCQIRYELIYYVLLKTDTNSAELNKLKEAILAEDEHPIRAMMESEHIIGNDYIIFGISLHHSWLAIAGRCIKFSRCSAITIFQGDVRYGHLSTKTLQEGVNSAVMKIRE